MFAEKLSHELHPKSEPVLKLNEVSVQYGNEKVLEGISFALDRGQRLAVLGPNGAGKSTLFKTITGLVKPQSGRVEIFGYEPGEHICIGYIPQRPQIDWSFPVTVKDVVMMGRVGKIGFFKQPSNKDKNAVAKSLDRVGISDLANKQISELSGGQQQRMFIARVLVQNANLVLLDEPLSGVDPPSQEAIFEILDLLKRMKITVLVATHDLDSASERFDLVMLLNRRIVSLAPAEDALTTSHLLETFGGHLHLLPSSEGDLVMADTCCDEGEMKNLKSQIPNSDDAKLEKL